jgi:hypothetical protein
MTETDDSLDSMSVCGWRTAGPNRVMAMPIQGLPSDGPADALVTIVYGIRPYERNRFEMEAVLARWRREHPDEIRVVYMPYGVYSWDQLPAYAECAARRQGRFDQMRALDLVGADAVLRDHALLRAWATVLGLDLQRYDADVQECVREVEDEERPNLVLGGLPMTAIYVNGHHLDWPVPWLFDDTIAEELRVARARQQTDHVDDYYSRWVLEYGQSCFDHGRGGYHCLNEDMDTLFSTAKRARQERTY